MAQAIAETLFDLFYLGFAVITGMILLARGQAPIVKKAGLMTLLLGAGDSFHLIPRSYALWTTGRKPLTAVLWALAAARTVLCLLPQNKWLSYRQPLSFGILRNIPFAVMGILIILISAQESRRTGDPVFRFMPLAVGLSFGFYLPVVLLSGVYPLVGMLMIPKTIAYVWMILMCLKLYRSPGHCAHTYRR